MRDTTTSQTHRNGDVVLGDDWIAPDNTVAEEMRAKRARRGFLPLRGSPLTRKIVTFNLIALIILVSGILYLNSTRDSLVVQRARTLVGEAHLVSDVFEAQLPASSPVNLTTGDGIDVPGTLKALTLQRGEEVLIFDTSDTIVGRIQGVGQQEIIPGAQSETEGRTVLTDGLSWVWSLVSGLVSSNQTTAAPDLVSQFKALAPLALQGQTQAKTLIGPDGGRVFSVATPILHNGVAVGVVVLTSPSGEVDALVRGERERVLQMFVVALLVSVGLSLVLASTIANPLADLAEAAELGRERNSRNADKGRIRIPDLSARPDEIGRLSRALRGMVKALYNRIDGNEQFAADVAHEIKNPLASLQSAVGTLRMVKRDDQREKLMEVIEHDVRRLDRLVSDISNASRLDAELVKEEQVDFDLLQMLGNLNQFLGEDARSKQIDYITDMPADPIIVHGLEARLAQVFVNLITNAISFCEEGDAIRVWARRRKNRVLIVVEDTGPGIPDQALTKIFKRFYSQRPDEHFGNNSGLGLAISKQIIESHGGVIWAENIRPTEADITSDPLGARFVVGLPL
ncbi:sensor histidine kinase [Aliisedimentitalea scapharcae]|uniref:histidine kinase n=1 Tax=Aliisedimentitalea scapharcae TaxID=1524259 RepID=A0ABZ2XUS2_9RHOB|nr:sensor histidine kinase [Rhodobacteraceae bacterium M382]